MAAVVVRSVAFGDQVTTCFHLRDLDGELSDFSYRKCLAGMFPGGRGRGGDVWFCNTQHVGLTQAAWY